MRRTILAGSGVAVLAIALAVWTAGQGLRAKNDLTQFADHVSQAASTASGGDATQASAALRDGAASAKRAKDLTSGWNWRLASRMPWLGEDVAALRSMTRVAA